MDISSGRRQALFGIGSAAAAMAAFIARPAEAAGDTAVAPGAATLRDLMGRLKQAPRRRDFRTVPMILEHREEWDSEALDEVIGYAARARQVWDNTEIESPWLNLMRNSVNAQVYSLKHPDFLAISATHGSAHLALYDQAMWDKYNLAALAGHGIGSNSFVVPSHAPSTVADHDDPGSIFAAPFGNNIPALQARGVVFLACHNAIWEQAGKLRKGGVNPDGLSQAQVAAELTNHLVDGVVLTPGVVGTLPELQMAGFAYAK